MTPVQIATAVLSLIAGIGVFLIACTMMSSNLESVSSNKLKKLFAKTSKSKLMGVGIGTVATAAIQSSGATSVMVIGFVNAGIMTLMQAATVIYGANIGTTITGQITALGMFENTISTGVIFATFAGIGAFIMAFAKKDVVKKIGGILAGFGMLFEKRQTRREPRQDTRKVRIQSRTTRFTRGQRPHGQPSRRGRFPSVPPIQNHLTISHYNTYRVAKRAF